MSGGNVRVAARGSSSEDRSNRDQRTQLDRLVLLFLSLAAVLQSAVVLVADAYCHPSRKNPPSVVA